MVTKAASVIEPPTTPLRKSRLWTRFRVRWSFLTRLCGSVPVNRELIDAWLRARQPDAKPEPGRSMQELTEEVLASLEASDEPGEFSELRFQRHDGHLAMRLGTVRAHIKDCARILSTLYFKGVKAEREQAFSTKVLNGVYPDEHEYWIPVRRPDGTPVTDGDGVYDKAVHVRGPRGEPLNALKRIEYIDPPCQMEFTLKVLNQLTKSGRGESAEIVPVTCIHEDDLCLLMEYGGTHGYAGERSDGEGRYEFTVERIDPA